MPFFFGFHSNLTNLLPLFFPYLRVVFLGRGEGMSVFGILILLEVS